MDPRGMRMWSGEGSIMRKFIVYATVNMRLRIRIAQYVRDGEGRKKGGDL